MANSTLWPFDVLHTFFLSIRQLTIEVHVLLHLSSSLFTPRHPSAVLQRGTMTKSKNATPKVVTPKMYQDLFDELESVSDQLSKTREQYWKTQDELKESHDKIGSMELHIQELVATHENDKEEMKKLQIENSTHVEEEAKVRESLDLMKKVFTRTQLRSKEDQETIMLLQEERDLLLEENKQLRDGGAGTQHDKAAISRMKRESLEREKQLGALLEKTKKELEEANERRELAEADVKIMTQRLALAKDPRETQEHAERQRERIDELERQLMELNANENALTKRAILDEDLDESLTRKFMSKIDCSAMSNDWSDLLPRA